MAKKKNQHHYLIYSLLSLAAVLLLLVISQLALLSRFYPGILVANTSVSVLSFSEASQKLTDNLTTRASQNLNFNYLPSTDSATPKQYSLALNPKLFNINTHQSLTQAFDYGHNSFYLPPLSLKVGVDFTPNWDDQINELAKNIDKDAIDSKLTMEGDQIVVTPSQAGLVLDRVALKKIVTDYLNTGVLSSTSLPVKTSYPKLSYQTALKLKERLDQIKLAPLKLTFKDQSFLLDLPTLISFIDTKESQPSLLTANLLGERINLASIQTPTQELTDSQISLNSQKVDDFLKDIASQVDQGVEEPLFEFDPASPQRVKQFRPPQEGRKLNIPQTEQLIASSLTTSGQTQIVLPVEVQKPQNKLVNDLGINELIGEGVSNFAHSIPNRIYNVTLAAQKINGVLIPPGQTFSFNQTVGDVTAATGFKQAYVIKSGKTVLDDGGGVCQVSTTLFRSALNAGLPIVDRTAHAYRVGYYEQGFAPGLDATTYYPSVDLKFKNDTDHHILIQTRIDGLTLYVDFYGTSDGRVAKITTPVILSQTPPLPDLRQDDPTLPVGEIKQVDFTAGGPNGN